MADTEPPPAEPHASPTPQPLFSTGALPSGPQADSNSSSSGGGSSAAASDSDSALGSFRSTKSSSLTTSAYHYRYEHGRRYHAERSAAAEYALPNDESEMDRLDLQHHLWRLTLSGSLYRAPLAEDKVRDVLDLGTGTGIWAIEVADQCPAAQVVGVDLSPIQPTSVPPNCRFYVDNFEAEWTYGAGAFDLVHSRLIVAACRDWPRLLARGFAALRGGGWMEIHESFLPVRCDDGSAAPDSPLLQWGNLITDGAAKIGVNMGIIPEIPHMMRAAGFEDVRVEWYAWPTNRWPKDTRLKEIGLWAYHDLKEGVPAISLGIIKKVLGWSQEEYDVLMAKVLDQLKDRKSHCYFPIAVIYGRKP